MSDELEDREPSIQTLDKRKLSALLLVRGRNVIARDLIPMGLSGDTLTSARSNGGNWDLAITHSIIVIRLILHSYI